jgi:hypothetical protein
MSKAVTTMIERFVMYGSETWPMTELDKRRLNTWERKILKTQGPDLLQGLRRIRHNQELAEM